MEKMIVLMDLMKSSNAMVCTNVFIFDIFILLREKISQITFMHLACLAPDHLCGDSTTCIVSNKICDGIMDCQDNSDEFNCSMFVFFI